MNSRRSTSRSCQPVREGVRPARCAAMLLASVSDQPIRRRPRYVVRTVWADAPVRRPGVAKVVGCWSILAVRLARVIDEVSIRATRYPSESSAQATLQATFACSPVAPAAGYLRTDSRLSAACNGTLPPASANVRGRPRDLATMTAIDPQSRQSTVSDTSAALARVYIDPDVVLSLPGAGPVNGATVASGAREALETLVETGHDLVFVTDRTINLPPDFPAVTISDRVDAVGRGWFLTTDPERCGPRRAGLQSILVGPGPSGTGHRSEIHRCDITTRDLHSAVIEILAREAMAPVA
jgi:hypothetical protein